jgi:hypothetical protein
MQFYFAINDQGSTLIKATQADAREVNKEFTSVDIPTDKPGLMAWVQQMLDETLNAGIHDVISIQEPTVQRSDCSEFGPGRAYAEPVTPPAPAKPEPVMENITNKLVRFEDEWENFPLSRKCHFASLAMEECRTILGRIPK